MAVTLGGILGFLALFLREMGWVFSGAMALTLIALYVVRRRASDAGWLLLAGGGVPALILGRNGFEAITDRSIEVGVDTWIMLFVMFGVACVGGLVVYATRGEAEQTHAAR